MESYLQGQDLWEIVGGDEVEQPKNVTALKKWRIKAGKVLFAIKTTIKEDMLEHVRMEDTKGRRKHGTPLQHSFQRRNKNQCWGGVLSINTDFEDSRNATDFLEEMLHTWQDENWLMEKSLEHWSRWREKTWRRIWSINVGEGTDLNKYIKEAWLPDYVSTNWVQKGAPIGLV